MKTHFLASLFALTAGLLAVGCSTSTEESQDENLSKAAQADVTRNDPTAIVEEINNNGAVYSARHLLLDGTAEWIALDNGVFTITTNDTDLKLQPGVYNMFVGAEVLHGGECDLCLHSVYDTYHSVISTGTYVTFVDP